MPYFHLPGFAVDLFILASLQIHNCIAPRDRQWFAHCLEHSRLIPSIRFESPLHRLLCYLCDCEQCCSEQGSTAVPTRYWFDFLWVSVPKTEVTIKIVRLFVFVSFFELPCYLRLKILQHSFYQYYTRLFLLRTSTLLVISWHFYNGQPNGVM